MERYRYLLLVFFSGMLTFFIPSVAHAQSEVNMVNGDTVFVNACATNEGVIYDDGGATGNYSNYFNGWVRLEATPGTIIMLSGEYVTESATHDWINVWDGAMQVVSHDGGAGTLSVTTVSGTLTLQFQTDGSVTRSGFAFTWTSDGTFSICNNAVSNLAVDTVTDTTVTLSWNAVDGAGPFTVYVDGSRYVAAGSPYTIQGLNPNVRYDVRVMSMADDSNFCCAEQMLVRTSCGLVRFPYSESFEDVYIGDFPECWLRQVNFDDNDYKPQVDGVHFHDGVHSLMLSCGGSNTGGHFGMVASPPLADTGSRTSHLNLMASHDGAQVVVGVCDSTGSEYDNYGFTPVATLTLTTSWTRYRVDWTATERGQRLALRMVQSMQPNTGIRVYLDEIAAENCGVDSLMTSQIDYDRVTLSWASFGSASTTVTVRVLGAVTDTLTFANAVSPLVITGLSPMRTYVFTVTPDCPGTASLASAISGTTSSMPRDAAHYCSPFLGSVALPDEWTFMTDARSSFDISDGRLRYYAGGYPSDASVAISERLMNLAGKRVTVEYVNPYGGNSIRVGTLLYVDDTSTFVPLGTFPYVSGSHVNTVTFDVPATCMGRHLAIMIKGIGYYSIYIKAVEICEPECSVAQESLLHRRGTSVQLDWTNVYDTVLVEYGFAGFTPGTGQTDTFYNASRGTIAGLTPNTDYHFFIYRSCGQVCPDRVVATRTATADYPLPYCESFTTLTDTRWNYGVGDWLHPNTINNTPRFNTSDDLLEMASWGLTWSYYSEAVLPDVEVDSATILSFYISGTYPEAIVGVGAVRENNNEGIYNSFREMDTIRVENGGYRRHYCYALRPSDTLFDGRLALKFYHDHEYEFFRGRIDDLQLSHSAYGNLDIIYLDEDTIVLSLDTLIGTDSAVVTLAGGGVVVNQVVTTSTMGSFGFGGLVPSTRYRIYVSLDEGCQSYATYIDSPGALSVNCIGCPGKCYPMDDVLSYELPLYWASTNGHNVNTNDELEIDAHSALVTHPYYGKNLVFHASSTVDGDTMIVGVYSAASAISLDSTHFVFDNTYFTPIDTLVLTTEWKPFSHPLPTPPGGSRICFLSGQGTLLLDNVGHNNCPIVDFTVEGSDVVCTVSETGSPHYILYIKDSVGTLQRTFIVEETPFRIQGLSMGTTYNFSVECPNSLGSGVCTQDAVVRTDDAIPLPYCVYFKMDESENSTMQMPMGWNVVTATSSQSVYPNANYQAALRVNNPSNRWMYVVLPEFQVDSALSVMADYFLEGDNYNDVVQFGVMNNGNDTGSFVPLYSQVAKGSSAPYYYSLEVDMSQHVGKRVAIRCSRTMRLQSVRVYNIPLAKYELAHADSIKITTFNNRPYWLREIYGAVDTVVYVDHTPYFLRKPTAAYSSISVAQATDSTGYTCENTRNMPFGTSANMPLCHSAMVGWPQYFQYYNTIFRDWVDSYHYRLGFNRGAWMVLPELKVDSMQHVYMKMHYHATSSVDSLVVGVMTDAYDTLTFTPVDTLAYVLADAVSQQAYVDFSAYADTGRWVALHYLNTIDANRHFYLDSVYMDTCLGAISADASLYRWNKIKIDAQAVPFYVEYYAAEASTQGNPGNSIVRVDSVPYILTLDAETKYRFHFHCDSLGYECRPPVDVTTLAAPLAVPSCTDFDTAAPNTMLRGWTRRANNISINGIRSHSGINSLTMPIGDNAYVFTPDLDIDSIQRVAMSIWYYTEDAADRLVVGVISNPSDLNTFHPIRTFASDTPGTWQRGLLEFGSAPEVAGFIALQARSNRQPDGRCVYVDDIYVDTSIAFEMRVKEITSSSLTLDWNQKGSADVTVAVKDSGVVVRTYNHAIPPLLIDSLNVLHYYTILFSSSGCGTGEYCNVNLTDSLSVITPAPGIGCINATDLNSPQAVFFRGTYNNPYAFAGAVNYGPQNPDTRHTVCYDTAERDPRTGNLLRTIPDGYTSSVRLGNWGSNYYSPEAEGVIYSLVVDTSSFELLLLRYAAVLQDPLHATVDQPRFRMELLDTNFNIIDSACTSADFIADQSLGWHTAANGVLWKDWTAVGVDLSGHAGEQVYFRLTTYDCNEGSHYGYAYFTLECMRKNTSTELCGDVPTNTLVAPEGFHYRWYNSLSPATISTAQSITVSSQDVYYYCDVSKIDNSSCYFTISAYGGTRYPMASFDTTYTIDSCHFVVHFTNTSTISKDGVVPMAGTSCETAYWDFGNGDTSTNYHDSTVYLLPGTYTVTLISGINEDACQDTAVMTLVLEIPEEILPSDTINAVICDNQSYLFYGDSYDTAGTYRYHTPNAGVCDSLHVLQLEVRSTNGSDTVAVVCDSLRWRGVFFAVDTDYTTPPVGLNAAGCDSTVTLHLTVHYSDTANLTDTVVENSLPYYVADTMLVFTDFAVLYPAIANGQWQLHTNTTWGCDSVLNLDLSVWRNRDTILDTSICRNYLPLPYHDSLFSPIPAYSTHTVTLPSTHATDSVVTLNITVYDNPTATYADTVVENDLPHYFRGIGFSYPIDTSLVLISSGIGCDTFADYSMHVWYNKDTTLYQSICYNEFPYLWEGYTFNSTDSAVAQGLSLVFRHDVVVPTTHGADSTLHLELTVKPVYDTTDTVISCPGYPFVYHDVDYGGPTSFDMMYTTRQGCDSLVHVALVERDSNYHLQPYYRFDSTEWHVADSILKGCAATLLEMCDSTVGAVAWNWSLFMADTSILSVDTVFAVAVDTGQNAMKAYISLIVSDTLGCYDTVGWPLFVFQRAIPDFQWSPDVPAMHNPEVQFENRTNPDTVAYLWRIQQQEGGGFDTTSLANPFYHWGETGDNMVGDYTVRLLASWSHTVDSFRVDTVAWVDSTLATAMLYESFTHTCIDSTERIVTITNDYLQFPNLVSPNGDGINDTWVIVNLIEFGNYSMNELWVYDRTGALVYHVKNIRHSEQFWDPNATRSPDGTYYYRFTAKGEYGVVKRNGLIEVLRD